MKTLFRLIAASLSVGLLVACASGAGSPSTPVTSLNGGQQLAAPMRAIVRPEKIAFASPRAPSQTVSVVGYQRDDRSHFGGNCVAKNVASVSVHSFYRTGAKFIAIPIAKGRCKELFTNSYGQIGALYVFVGK